MRNAYMILGVSRKSTQEDVRRAYHLKARRHHPDSMDRGQWHGYSDKNEFEAASWAYEWLLARFQDPELREIEKLLALFH